MKIFFKGLVILLAATGCSQHMLEEHPACTRRITIQTETSNPTKTNITGTTISWTKGDRLGLYIGDIHENVPMSNAKTDNLNSFKGGIDAKGVPPREENFYIYYPYVDTNAGPVLSARLPSEQTAPFDPSANFMSATSLTALYDETDMPHLAFNFDTQFFGLIKLQIRNTNAKYKDETIHKVSFTALEGGPLCGDFSFDVTDPVNTIKFSDIEGRTSSTITSVFAEYPKIGTEDAITVYLFVNPGTYRGLLFKIQTDNYIATFKSSGTIAVERGDIVNMPVMDIAKEGAIKKVLKAACWGDSLTHSGYDIGYPPYLQSMLGAGWQVYDGGEPGGRCADIMSRQGSLKVYLKSGFDLPASSGVTVGIEGVYLEDSELTSDKDRPFQDWWSTRTRLLNPCTINGVEVVLTKNSVRRVNDGEEMHIQSNTEVKTFGARLGEEVDLTILYVGQNGGYKNDYDLLIKQHWAMINATKSKRYLVLAFHGGKSTTGDYLAKMDAAFGADHVIHLRQDINARAGELLLRTGVYSDLAQMSEMDKNYIANGNWPYSFYYASTGIVPTDTSHPSEEGAQAMAILIYERMQDLGYLDL